MVTVPEVWVSRRTAGCTFTLILSLVLSSLYLFFFFFCMFLMAVSTIVCKILEAMIWSTFSFNTEAQCLICTDWLKVTHFDLLNFPNMSPSKHPLLLMQRRSGPFDLKSFISPSFPISLCLRSYDAISIGVHHASTFLTHLAFSFLLSVFLSVWFFQSLINFFCYCPSLCLLCCFYTVPF